MNKPDKPLNDVLFRIKRVTKELFLIIRDLLHLVIRDFISKNPSHYLWIYAIRDFSHFLHGHRFTIFFKGFLPCLDMKFHAIDHCSVDIKYVSFKGKEDILVYLCHLRWFV